MCSKQVGALVVSTPIVCMRQSLSREGVIRASDKIERTVNSRTDNIDGGRLMWRQGEVKKFVLILS